MQDLTPEEEKILRVAYSQTFGTEAGQVVLKDLAKRCFKYTTTYKAYDLERQKDIYINEGARQVLLTIEELMSNEGIQKLAKSSGKE
ncbi:hypothetical protein LCGC14_2467890 [marine sediment metagenome]|uniref:Bbp19-like phage domain-containing protein n=1 Tax=marine sediment metagenome TaxID=412755 RepID=A0A0F9BZ38_9ZZZZ